MQDDDAASSANLEVVKGPGVGGQPPEAKDLAASTSMQESQTTKVESALVKKPTATSDEGAKDADDDADAILSSLQDEDFFPDQREESVALAQEEGNIAKSTTTTGQVHTFCI